MKPLRLLFCGGRPAGGPLATPTALATLLAALLAPGAAHAQADLNPAQPNVMLLVDTSGSMEYEIGGTSFPSCFPTGSQTSEKSRWVDLVEVLTGSITNYRCEALSRTASGFRTGEYGIGGPTGVEPYDYLYENPFHRPLSGDCVAAPGTLSASNAYAFPEDDASTASAYEGAVRFHKYDNTTTNCSFNQSSDGILDSFERSARFGLMTFDPLPDPGTGVSGTTPNYTSGRDGTWSYVWGSSIVGRPEGCSTDQPFEVGARNAAAPPWEGRMVAFGDPASGSLAYLTKKSQIERILLSTRPYGATPIAGMLKDARDFFLNDTSNDPLDSSKAFSPRSDPYVLGGCRDQFAILLSDGQPNMDLRPYCEGTGNCPIDDKPEDIAFDLAGQTHPIYTYVVGFALPSFTVGTSTVTCNDLTLADFDETDPTKPCGNPANASNTALQACCALNRIAVKGGKESDSRAFFASSQEELASALSEILKKTSPVTSRTQPVVSGAAGGAQGLRFFSSMKPISFQPWVGVLERQRYTCTAVTVPGVGVEFIPEAVEISANDGDDFAANLNSGAGRERLFVSVEGGIGTQPIVSTGTIRPAIDDSDGDPDGAGAYKGELYADDADGFVAATDPEAMQLTATSCSGGLSAAACRDRYLNWLVGIDNDTPYTRCKALGGAECFLFGDITHSTPRLVGPPAELLRDESYEAYAQAKASRPLMLYTSTNDGFLHAFKVAANDPTDNEKVNSRANNELWAFVPPAILPELPSQYPFTRQLLLDGVPVVKDVVASIDGDDVLLERSAADAQAGAGDWRTILVQSFGAARPGYFALDVTNPVPGDNPATSGPRFLWQITTDVGGNPLFGLGGTTPLITTLFFDPGDGDAREIAVAVLPGGSGGVGSSGSGAGCPATARTFADVDIDDRFPPRGRAHCYSGQGLGGRSLTVVRLDSGEIVRTFRQAAGEVLQDPLKDLVTEVDIDSPITGQPVAFPAQTGAVADRVYVGDQDGRLWRVELGSTDPESWDMKLFFDAFPASSSTDAAFVHGFGDGQAILLPPVVSVDENGDVTVNVATGDQDTLGAAGSMKNYVWSLTERTSNDRQAVETRVNWVLPLASGERVVGPMILFSSKLYFSSFTPPSSSAVCDSGTSRVWGMDYLLPVPSETDGVEPPVNQGGQAALPKPSDPSQIVQVLTGAEVTGDASSVIFGVSVAQQPTCSALSTESPNDFLGYGAHHQVTSVNPGKFELVMHTGSGGTSVDGGTTKAVSVALSPPASSTRVDSWAALVE